MHLAFHAAGMQVHAYMFGICVGGFQEAWSVQGDVPDGEEDSAVSSVGRERL